MPPPEINYKLHDARVVAVLIGPRREATLVVDLDLPEPLRVEVRFGGLINIEKVWSYFQRVREQGINSRVDCFCYDRDTPSSSSSLWF